MIHAEKSTLGLKLHANAFFTIHQVLVLVSHSCDTAWAQDSRSFINTELDTPKWLDINAEARWRSEGQLDIGFKDGND